jgi:capsule assembly protein Wzi/PAP2 superfamily protein
MVIRRQIGILGAALLFGVSTARVSSAQEQGTGPSTSEAEPAKHNASPRTDTPLDVDAIARTSQGTQGGLVERFVDDQRRIWTSPARLRFSDTEWLVPLSGIAAGLFATDRDFSKHLSHNPTTINHYKTLSNAGVAALLGGAGGMWLLGHTKHNEHWSETGFLAGEAALNSLVAVEGLKYSLRRERPYQGDGSGSFFHSGGTSFPSAHVAAAWSIAGVIAHEYPGPLTKIMAYGLASLVSVSRVRARQHFPSDVLVGAVIGNLVAQNIYSRHHDLDLGGGEWKTYAESHDENSEGKSHSVGSPYVELDSWIYPALERLAVLGYIDSHFLGMRPWTRLECAQLVEEAGDRILVKQVASSDVTGLYTVLSREFQSDLHESATGNEGSVHLESLYTNVTEITGEPLNDSYHFGQTIINNYGRPYQHGFNTYDGFSGWATKGRFVIYVRGEYQHAPSAPGFSQPIQNLIGSLDTNPVQPATPIAATNQFRLLDTYVAANVANWDLTFGKQSLWWGPGDGGALLFSDNAEPIYMFRASRITPITLPWILRYLGPMKLDSYIGKLSGNDFPPRPVIHGEKISFKPTRNLEISFTRMAEMGGLGRALTPAAFWHSYTSPRESNFYASNDNPGKRTAGFDFSYRVPYLRNWLTVYTDSLSSDDVTPISAPRRAAINPGIYLSHLPKLPKLDLRIEGVNTNTPSSSFAGKFVYIDNFYHDLSTNKGNIIGSWIGRQGQGVQAWSNYWFSARSSLQFGYRHAKVAPDFIPQGETLDDEWVKANWWLRESLSVSAFVQHEQWVAPVLASTPQTNWTSSIGISFQPHGFTLAKHSSREEFPSGKANEDARQ